MKTIIQSWCSGLGGWMWRIKLSSIFGWDLIVITRRWLPLSSAPPSSHTPLHPSLLELRAHAAADPSEDAAITTHSMLRVFCVRVCVFKHAKLHPHTNTWNNTHMDTHMHTWLHTGSKISIQLSPSYRQALWRRWVRVWREHECGVCVCVWGADRQNKPESCVNLLCVNFLSALSMCVYVYLYNTKCVCNLLANWGKKISYVLKLAQCACWSGTLPHTRCRLKPKMTLKLSSFLFVSHTFALPLSCCKVNTTNAVFSQSVLLFFFFSISLSPAELGWVWCRQQWYFSGGYY